MSIDPRLTGKQHAFVSAYLVSWNATRAAAEAGYAGNNVTLASVGSKLLRNDKVKAAIADRLRETAVDADQALAALWGVAMADPGALAEVMAEGSPSAAMATARRLRVSRLVKAISPMGHGVNVTWHDPLRALEIIMRHIGTQRHEIGVENLDVKKMTDAELEYVVKHGCLPG